MRIESFPQFVLPQREGPFLLQTEFQLTPLPPEIKELFENFYESLFWEEMVAKAQAIDWSSDKKKWEEGVDYLAGEVFELLSYFYLAKRIGSEEFLLSPKATFEFYRVLGLDQKGITIPDGLIFRREEEVTTISGFCEYTLQRHTEERKARQLRYYQGRFVGKELDRKLAFAELVSGRFLPRICLSNVLQIHLELFLIQRWGKLILVFLD